MTMTDYCQKIDKILAAMFHLVDRVKPKNRSTVNRYLHHTWKLVKTMTHSIDKEYGTDFLRAKFESWVTAEEDRLRTNLEDFQYWIDADSTMSLITGPGRIETVGFM
jgi:hypothetical protein